MKAPLIKILKTPTVRKNYRECRETIRAIESRRAVLIGINPFAETDSTAYKAYGEDLEFQRGRLASFWQFSTVKLRVRVTKNKLFLGTKYSCHLRHQDLDFHVRNAIWMFLKELNGGHDHTQTVSQAERILQYWRKMFPGRKVKVVPPDRSADVEYLKLQAIKEAAAKQKKPRKIKLKLALADGRPDYSGAKGTK